MLGRAKRVVIDKDNTTIINAPATSRDQEEGRFDPQTDRRDDLDYDKEKSRNAWPALRRSRLITSARPPKPR